MLCQKMLHLFLKSVNYTSGKQIGVALIKHVIVVLSVICVVTFIANSSGRYLNPSSVICGALVSFWDIIADYRKGKYRQ